MFRSRNRVGHLSHAAVPSTSAADVTTPYALKRNEAGSVSCFVCRTTPVSGSDSPACRYDFIDPADGASTSVETGFSEANHVEVPLLPFAPFVCAETVA